MLTAREMPFHSGITLRIYPSNVQKRIIAKNDGAQRAMYNKLVAYSMERYRLSKAIALTPCYNERLDYLDQVLGKISELQNMLPFLNDKEIDSLAIANGSQNYRKAWANYRKHPEQFGIPTFHKKARIRLTRLILIMRKDRIHLSKETQDSSIPNFLCFQNWEG